MGLPPAWESPIKVLIGVGASRHWRGEAANLICCYAAFTACRKPETLPRNASACFESRPAEHFLGGTPVESIVCVTA
jgi:hypothetical protein